MQIRALVAVVFLMAPMTLSAQVMQMIDRLFDFEHVLVYVMAALLMGIFVLLFYNFIYHYRELDAKTEGLSQYARLSLVLQTSNLQLWFYNVQRRHYVLLKESGEYSREYNPVEFAELVIKKSGRSCRIVPVRDAELPSHARRPLNSRLTAELPAGIAPMPSVEDALNRYLEEIIH